MTEPLATAGRRPSWVDADLFPFESRFVNLMGHSIHYVDEGEGPTLLLYHGNPSWSFLYRNVIIWLRRDFRCIAFDYPGMGLSAAAPGFGYRASENAAVAEAFVERLDLREVTPMIQDWGGPIGLAAAARHPERYRAIIVGNTWGWPASTTGEKISHHLFSALWGGPIGRAATRRFNLFPRFVLPAGHKRMHLSKREMTQYLAPYEDRSARSPCYVLPREITRARDLLREVETGLRRLEVLPALILWATKDFAFKNAARRRWERTFPVHRTHLLEGAGHFLQDDAGDEVCRTMREWWLSIE